MSTDRSGEATSAASRRTSSSGSAGTLRLAALVAVAAGAVGSVVFLLIVGHRDSQFVVALVGVWVLSPFVALALAHTLAKRWSAFTRSTLHSLMLILAVGSLAAYGRVALNPPTSKRAFMFVAVPLVSWGLIVVLIPLAALISSRLSRRGSSG